MQIPDRLAVWPDEGTDKGRLAPVPGGAGAMPVTIDARKRHRRDIAFDPKRPMTTRERKRRNARAQRAWEERQRIRQMWMEEGQG